MKRNINVLIHIKQKIKHKADRTCICEYLFLSIFQPIPSWAKKENCNLVKILPDRTTLRTFFKRIFIIGVLEFWIKKKWLLKKEKRKFDATVDFSPFSAFPIELQLKEE